VKFPVYLLLTNISSKPLINIPKNKVIDLNIPEKSDIIYNSSCLDMKEIPDESIQMIITSPPYNVGKEYEEILLLDEYERFAKTWMLEAKRVLVIGGRLCIIVANTNRKPFSPLPDYYSTWGDQLDFLNRGKIIWEKIGRSGDSTSWGSWLSASNPFLRDTTEDILFLLRYDPIIYELIEEIHKYICIFSKDQYKLESSNKIMQEKMDFMRNTISLYKSEDVEENQVHWKIRCETGIDWHPAPFPVELPRRLIRLYSFPGNYILDMFSGSGSRI